MNKEFLKMQKTAGLITESEYKSKLNEAFVNDKGELEDFSFENDLVVKYTPEYYQNEKDYKFFYCEKGLTNNFTMMNGKKVKEIIGYSNFIDLPDDKKWILNMPDPKTELEKNIPGFILDPDGCSNAEFEVIGYIYSKSGKDIETEYEEDELYDAFYDSLGA
jgi:hypothetical protein